MVDLAMSGALLLGGQLVLTFRVTPRATKLVILSSCMRVPSPPTSWPLSRSADAQRGALLSVFQLVAGRTNLALVGGLLGLLFCQQLLSGMSFPSAELFLTHRIVRDCRWRPHSLEVCDVAGRERERMHAWSESPVLVFFGNS